LKLRKQWLVEALFCQGRAVGSNMFPQQGFLEIDRPQKLLCLMILGKGLCAQGLSIRMQQGTSKGEVII
jgi:hypothetical protein